jgi:DNA-directed RNA polymerase specialized sigma24 family protein
MNLTSHDRPALSQEALDSLLARLAPDADAAGSEYEAIRRRLIGFFDRRGATCADWLTDRTLDRVARKIEGGEQVEHLRAYVFGVGKRVWLEWQRELGRERTALESVPAAHGPDEAAREEARLACLERCLAALPAERRDLIVDYYRGRGRRHLESRTRLAANLGLKVATLRSRASRIREQLEACLARCLDDGPVAQAVGNESAPRSLSNE